MRRGLDNREAFALDSHNAMDVNCSLLMIGSDGFRHLVSEKGGLLMKRSSSCSRLLLSVALVVALTGMWGCGKVQKPPREPGRYYSDKGFSIRLPETWEQKEGFMGTTVMTLSPKETATDAFRENANVAVEAVPRGTTLPDYFSLSLGNMRKMMTDFKKHEEDEATLDGQPAKRVVYSFRVGEMNLKTLVYFTVRGKRAYVITATASPETFDDYRPQFEKITQTWRFE